MIMSFNAFVGMVVSGFIRTMDMGVLQSNRVLDHQYSSNFLTHFLYGNHTNDIADALIPSLSCFPKDVSVIVHPNNVSMPFLGRITPFLGALPLPDDAKAAKNFNKAIKHKIDKN